MCNLRIMPETLARLHQRHPGTVSVDEGSACDTAWTFEIDSLPAIIQTLHASLLATFLPEFVVARNEARLPSSATSESVPT